MTQPLSFTNAGGRVMTDTVNVPPEPTEAMIEAGYDETRLAGGYPQFSDAGFCLGHARSIYRAMLAAAPKAESVSDPDKLAEVEKRLVAVFDVQEVTLERVKEASVDIAAIFAQPEAPKVEQEPVAWRYRFVTSTDGKELSDWFIVDNLASIPAREQQTVQPLHAHPAPASDELLEALEAIAEEFEHAPDDKDKFGYPIQSPSIYAAWQVVRGFIDKHKGPQS